jgi:hypothetical protein
MEEQKQNFEEQREFLPELQEDQESPEEQARIDALVAHNPAEDVIDLGKVEDLEKIPDPVAPEKTETIETEMITMPKSKVVLIKKMAQNLRDSAAQLAELLTMVSDEEVKIKIGQIGENKAQASAEEGQKVVEGLFDGEKMVGPDGKVYDVPVNYASKSRLVEGDLLKLIITASGTFIFKQIKPVERRRVVGLLEESETGEYYVMYDDRRWRVLNASVTYYKGESGDEAVIVVPKEGLAKWGAVENIIKR